MAALATVTDVENRWRPLSADETTVATTLLDDASEALRFRIPNLDQKITDGDVSEDLATATVVSMVVRVLRNPDAIKQESVGSYSRTFMDDPQLMVTSDDLELLTPSSSTAAFTITPYGKAPS